MSEETNPKDSAGRNKPCMDYIPPMLLLELGLAMMEGMGKEIGEIAE